MKFDAVKEWVKAFHELQDPNLKIAALEKVMKFLYPQLAPQTEDTMRVIEMEAEMIDVTGKSTEDLLLEIDTETLNDSSQESKSTTVKD